MLSCFEDLFGVAVAMFLGGLLFSFSIVNCDDFVCLGFVLWSRKLYLGLLGIFLL